MCWLPLGSCKPLQGHCRCLTTWTVLPSRSAIQLQHRHKLAELLDGYMRTAVGNLCAYQPETLAEQQSLSGFGNNAVAAAAHLAALLPEPKLDALEGPVAQARHSWNAACAHVSLKVASCCQLA